MPTETQGRSGRFALQPDGWVAGAERIESPNCDERPPGTRIELLVVHGISLPPGCFGGGHVERLFVNALDHSFHPYFEDLRGLRVSAHFFIRRGGELVQFVSCQRRAWHAGVSSWRGRSACNDYSIGIEFEGADDLPYEPAQYVTAMELIAALRNCYPIEAIVGHCDIAPARKTDPGACFDWSALGQEAALLRR